MTSDEDVTRPIVTPDKLRAVFGSVDLNPGERGEIVLAPEKPVRDPQVYLTELGCRDVVVEEVLLGQRVLASSGRWPAEIFWRGQELGDFVATRDAPVKIVVRNTGAERITVGATLAGGTEEERP